METQTSPLRLPAALASTGSHDHTTITDMSVRTAGIAALGALLALAGTVMTIAVIVTVVQLFQTGRAWGVEGSAWADGDAWELVAIPAVGYGMCRLGISLLVASRRARTSSFIHDSAESHRGQLGERRSLHDDG